MKKILVLDNVLEEIELRQMQDVMFNKYQFPWYYNKEVNTSTDPKEHFQFTHNFYDNFAPRSNFFSMIGNLILKIKAKSLVRAKANLLTITPKIIEHGMHYDQDERNTGIKVAIFYVNSNNGYTTFENHQRVESVENRLAIFDGELQHSGSTCTDTNARVVINFNYF